MSASKKSSGGLVEQAVLGNQAIAERVGRSGVDSSSDQELVLSEATDRIQRAVDALYAEPRPQAVVEKYLRVINNSRLPSDRKIVLTEKLTSDQEAARSAQEATKRWFGDATTGLDVFDRVQQNLSQTQSGTVEQRIEEAGQELGRAAVGFCREVYLILAFQEEEEEELVSEADVEIEG